MQQSLVKRLILDFARAYIEAEGISVKAMNPEKVVRLAQDHDPRLQRVKKKQLQEAMELATYDLKRLELQNAAAAAATNGGDGEVEGGVTGEAAADSDFEGTDPDKLMTVTDTQANKMNKSVVDLWKVPPADMEKRVPKEGAPAPPAGGPAEKPKRKKRKTEHASKRPASAVTLADFGGIDKIIAQIKELLVMPLSHPEVYMHLGSDIPRGVLLHGPPGCGKTMLANAIANELGVTFINVSAPSVVSGMSGESEKKLREIFDEAIEAAPSLVFIDEIDAITPKRENVQREMERRIVAQLLTCMDDVALDKTGGKPVMVIGATNRPDAIDAALRRGGRFDHEIAMTVPDQESRARILQTIARKLTLEGNFDFDALAKLTPGFVGADLNALVSAAASAAIKRIFRNFEALPAAGEVLGDPLIEEKGGDPAQSAEPESADADTEMHDGTAEAGPAESGVAETGQAGGSGEPSETQANGSAETALAPAPTGPISGFLARHPDPLTPEQLAPLSISFADFLAAIPTIQPSSKREGFATVPDVTWEDVGAMAQIREELEFAIVEPVRRPEVYAAAGISAPSGVLLWGPPGCGKTLLAKAVANESRANFISVRGPELLNKYVGESERAVRQVFVRARASVPCVIFFDELDALVPRRDDSNSESASRVVNTLLTELDGVGERRGVFVVAATNRPDMIDAAMLRPGRLDKQLFVELPSPDERAEILRTVSRSAPLAPDVDLAALAHDERCRNFSGADLHALVREATVLALKGVLRGSDGPVQVHAAHLDAAFGKVRPSVGDAERQKYYLMRERLAS